MEMWTHSEEGKWRRWSHTGPGLDAVAGASPRIDQVLVIGSDPADDEQLLAAIRLTRRLAGGPVTLIAGSEHPSACWCDSVRNAGADRTLLVSRPKERCWNKQPPLEDGAEIGPGICPALHVHHEHDVTLSVCGRCQDRMVLVRHHFDRWCLAAKEECPHWRGGPGG